MRFVALSYLGLSFDLYFKKWSTTLWIQDPSISEATNLKWGFELTVWATSDSIHRLPRAEPGEIVVAHPVKLTGRLVLL